VKKLWLAGVVFVLIGILLIPAGTGALAEAEDTQLCGGCECAGCNRSSWTFSEARWLGGQMVQSILYPTAIVTVPEGWQCFPNQCVCQLYEIVPYGSSASDGTPLCYIKLTMKYGRGCQ